MVIFNSHSRKGKTYREGRNREELILMIVKFGGNKKFYSHVRMNSKNSMVPKNSLSAKKTFPKNTFGKSWSIWTIFNSVKTKIGLGLEFGFRLQETAFVGSVPLTRMYFWEP